ncbi:MAG TPA: glycosyltransferase [Steroidobacteraceae bacterium]|nr:glycosyltransferase [Steroidobacteraceae bacterium]
MTKATLAMQVRTVNESAQAISLSKGADAGALPKIRARWLFIDGANAFGGHEVMLVRWLEELNRQRTVEPFLLAPEGSRLFQEGSKYAVTHALPRQEQGAVASKWGVLKDSAALMRAIRAVEPDLCVVAEGCLMSQPAIAHVARLLGLRVVVYVPLVQTSVSMGFGRGELRDALVRRWYANLPHGWVTITAEQAEDFRRWAGVRKPILTLPNTVAAQVEQQASVEVRSATSNDKRLRVLVLGRLDAQQKGLDLLLAHMRKHPQLGEHLLVTLVGDGPFEAEIQQQLTQDTALRRWLALRSWSPTSTAMRDHDVLLMSSRFEGVPLVMLEAMAMGLPVVAPDLPGTRAFLEADCMFPKGNMDAAFKILDRMVDPTIRAQIETRNRSAFRAQASNASFESAVRELTPRLQALGRAARQRRSA